MRNLISGIVGVLWGGAIVVYGLTNRPEGSDAYQAGGYAAVVFGVLLLVGGVYYLRKGLRERAAENAEQH
jgi:hypothetical protein